MARHSGFVFSSEIFDRDVPKDDGRPILECCVEQYEGSQIAVFAGAKRLELCSNLNIGGTTPTAGFIKLIKTQLGVPAFCLIRPRGGNFIYDPVEMYTMKEDIRASIASGADGLVLGVLKRNGFGHLEVDEELCKELKNECGELPVTFHRAFDYIFNKIQALQVLKQMGFCRILTAGGEGDAVQHTDVLQELVTLGGEDIIVMPGGKIDEKNIFEIHLITRATEFHASCRGCDDNEKIKGITDFFKRVPPVLQDIRIRRSMGKSYFGN